MTALAQLAARDAESPTFFASRLLERPIEKPATMTANTISPINATHSSVLLRPPSAVRAAIATIGEPSTNSWFQIPRHGDRETYRPTLEAPPLQHPELGRHPNGCAPRCDETESRPTRGRHGARSGSRDRAARP